MPSRQRQSQATSDNAFDRLVQRLSNILGPTDGINSASVNVKELEQAMSEYTSSECEWQRFAFADTTRNYTRNLVDRGNGKANLLILVWTPDQSSPIHDHTDSHCVMKVLKGSLEETLFTWPCETSSRSLGCATSAGRELSTKHVCSEAGDAPHSAALQRIKVTSFARDEVTYMSDMLGLHRIRNPSTTETAVSLHLYTPPNAALHGCNIFVEQTGERHHVQQCGYYSEMGVKSGARESVNVSL